jgi:hypothetical protein
MDVANGGVAGAFAGLRFQHFRHPWRSEPGEGTNDVINSTELKRTHYTLQITACVSRL